MGYSGDSGMSFHSTQHSWTVSTSRGRKNVFQGGSTNGNLVMSNVLNSQKFDTQIGDPFGGLTGSEKGNLRQNGGGRGIFNFTGGNGNTGLPSDPGTGGGTGRVPIPVPPGP